MIDAIKVKDEQRSFNDSFTDVASVRKLGQIGSRFDTDNEISRIEVNNDQTYDQIEEVAKQL
jgi:hypothetical protein